MLGHFMLVLETVGKTMKPEGLVLNMLVMICKIVCFLCLLRASWRNVGFHLTMLETNINMEKKQW